MSTSDNHVEKVVIIGSGPAGWTAAIYAGRAHLNPLVLAGGGPTRDRFKGGQLMYTSEVENYPGFVHGVRGPALMEEMEKQAERCGARVKLNTVNRVDLTVRPFKVWHESAITGDDETMTLAHTIIIATGAAANYLGLPGEREFENNGVSACAVCDGNMPRFRDRPLVVVGGGDSAAEESTYLTKFASKVYLVHRRDSLRASKVMANRALENPKIVPMWNSAVKDIVGNEAEGVTAVKVAHVETGKETLLEASGMFAAIGHTPNTAFLNGQIQLNAKGYVVLKDGFRALTSVEGVYASGDCADSTYRQAITAAGMGCKAALDAERWLAERGID